MLSRIRTSPIAHARYIVDDGEAMLVGMFDVARTHFLCALRG